MNSLKKQIAGILTLAIMITNLTFSIGSADGRLTAFQDALSRIKRSGTGASTSGYAESNAAIRSKFVIVNDSNDKICLDVENDGLDAAGCVTDDDTLVDLITDGGAVSGTAYTGAELADIVSEGIETAIRANVGDLPDGLDESFTVTYVDLATNSFVFAPGVNEDIYVDYEGVGPGDTTLDLISDAGLTAHTAYTGAEVATALAAALNALDTDNGGDDVYTVTYSTTTELFTITNTAGTSGIFIEWTDALSTAALYLGYTADDTILAGTGISDVPADYINRFYIRADGGNDYNPDIMWTGATTTAEGVLGYTADDADIRDAAAVSDAQIQFNVVLDVNDTFYLDLNGESSNGSEIITVDAGNYTGTELAAQLDTEIDADWAALGWAATVTATYSSERFTISAVTTGTESYVHVDSHATKDFLPYVDMVNDIPKDGRTTSVIVSADHTLTFATDAAVPPSGQVIITFPSGFVIPDALNYLEIDFGDGVDLDTITERTLAAANGAGTVGATVDTSARTLTFHLATDDGIDAGDYVRIRVGRNTITAGTGIEQIINPTLPGMYQIGAETKTATLLTFTTGTNDEIVWDPDGTDKFVFNAATNEDIYFDADGSGLPGDTTADLITNGGLVANTEYTGDQVAAAIKAALEAQNGSADTYTVSYDETTNMFSIQPLVGTTELNIDWNAAESTAGRLLGFTADDVDLYTAGIWTSDYVAGTYVINVISQSGAVIVSGTAIAPTAIDSEVLEVIFEDTATYPSAGVPTYEVSYAAGTGKFTIAETAVPNGSEPIFYWTWDATQEAAITSAAYTLGYTADDEAGLAFSLEGDITSITKQIDTAYTAVYIVDNDQITISAGVDPNLAMEINGGLSFASVEGDRDTLGIDFGALEPNAYYKLGGAKTEYGKIEVKMNCGAGTNEACIPATNDYVTIRGVNYYFKRVAADAATQSNFVYASITGTTQQQRAAKLLTNLYRAINSTDVNVRANIDRSSDTVLWILSTSEGNDASFAITDATDTSLPSDITVSTVTGVNSYFYKDNDTAWGVDPTTYQTDLSGVSDFRGHNIKINTNAADGYTLQIRDEGVDETSPFRTWSDSVDLGFGIYAYSQSTRWGAVGNTADGDDLIQESFQGGETNNKDPQGLSTTYQTLARDDVSTARDNISIEYNVRIDADQPSGNYQTTLDLMLSAQY